MWRAADGAPLARRIADGLAERAILLQYAAGGRQARDGRGCCPRLDRPPLGPLILAAASWRGSSSEMLALLVALASTLNLKLSRALRLKRVRVFCELLSIVYRLAAERPPHHLTAPNRAPPKPPGARGVVGSSIAPRARPRARRPPPPAARDGRCARARARPARDRLEGRGARGRRRAALAGGQRRPATAHTESGRDRGIRLARPARRGGEARVERG